MVRSLKNREGSSDSVPSLAAKVWQPGVDELEEGEELQCDPSAYNSLHAFHIGWPCMSFDVVRDSLGLVRTEFPHTVYCVAGTQAEKSSWNSIGIFKLSNISGKRQDLVPSDENSDMDSESSDSDEEEEDTVLQLRKVSHEGCVNRIRAMAQNPNIVASWADSGHVQVWDFSSHLNALAESESHGASAVSNQSPLVKFGGHKDEGYAIDWSLLEPGRLLSGDCKNCIYLWEPTSGTWNIDANPFIGHTASVEDLQRNSPSSTIKTHKADVNVISWNKYGTSEGRDTTVDLMAYFEYHKHPITSIEWSPPHAASHDASSIVAVSSSDNQLTIWDLSLERDEEEEAEFKAQMKEQVNAPTDLPPLLFVHQGQKDLKELHWHPQIPGMVISTAADGFNILMPSNIENALPA
ncbi:hypothetical protein R3W88_029091 [Solanum pinnatisectum]|uniref:Histone-binding protein RBBP4-like N-terminal domain-containing protein n=1 Tax=Solanum pinnatisectum TaxID=50273 RepID=A0AAV9K4A1_9SOLN|nr:hypothetical protein R3W88_029091 [Solanum pinnatisectum]